MKILLFGGGLQVLSAARSLKEVGFQVENLVFNDRCCYYSAFIDKYHELGVPLPDVEESTLICRFISINPSVIIPTQDLYAEYLSKVKTDIHARSAIKCAIVDKDVLSLVTNKYNLMDYCKRIGVPHPKTISLNEDNLEYSIGYVGVPCLIKPNTSEGARGITYIDSINKLKEEYNRLKSIYGGLSLQEYISSRDYYYNLMIYRSSEGQWSNYVITKILRYYPIKGGSSSLCITIDVPEMAEVCKKLLDSINWVGFADFDILEKDSGDYRIIELNPRLPASIRAAAISGVNFPECIVNNMLGKGIKTYSYQPGRFLRYLGLDLAWFCSSPKRFSAKPSWFKFLGKNIYYQDGGIKDYKSMIIALISGIKKQLNPKFRESKSGMN